MTDTDKTKYIAIDFGTTNSCCFYSPKGKLFIALDNTDDGGYLFPSFVEYLKDGNVLVGKSAKANLGKTGKFVVSCVKRLIGKTYEEYETLEEKNIFGCDVVEGPDHLPRFVVSKDGRTVSCEEVAIELFRKIITAAKTRTEADIKYAYVTVPAYFKDNQASAIRRAARAAGIEVKKMITEPTAAAMSWCLVNKDKLSAMHQYIVYDFGGGTFDVSFLQYLGNNRFTILDTEGDSNLGGNDVDVALAHFVEEEYKNRTHKPLIGGGKLYKRKFDRLRNLCEEAKIALLAFETFNVNIESFVGADDDDSVLTQITISRHNLAEVAKDCVKRSIDVVKKITDKTGQNVGNIRKVFLVGGSTRLGCVQDAVKSHFCVNEFPPVNPDESVARGAMQMLLNDLDPNSNTMVKEKIVLSYGLEVEGKQIAIILRKGVIIPALHSVKFTNTEDKQNHVDTSIYQVEGDIDGANNTVPINERAYPLFKLQFPIEDPKPLNAGLYEITFKLDVGGVLNVDCIDVKENKSLSSQVISGVYGGK